MRKKKPPNNGINLTIGGDIANSQIAVGSNIQMRRSIHAVKGALTSEEVKELSVLIEALQAQVRKDAPRGMQDLALEKLSVFATSITLPKPDTAMMARMLGWFSENIPAVSGAVMALSTHPLVVKLMRASGEESANEFKHQVRSSKREERRGADSSSTPLRFKNLKSSFVFDNSQANFWLTHHIVLAYTF